MCLWLIAVNINDPVSQRIYTVAVQLVNLNALTSAGKYVEILDDTDTIRVTVRASRSVFSDFSEKNIVATADVSAMTDDNRLPIEITHNKSGSKIESIKSDKDYVEVGIENMMKMQKRIGVNVVNEPAEGYMLGNRSTDQNAVIISGPESVVSRVASTSVEINVDGATSDVNIALPVHLYDADGREINDSKLTKSVNNVFTTVSILQKKEIPIEYVVTGKPAEGYVFSGEFIKNPSTVTIAAKPAVLKNIESLVIDNVIDLTGANKDVEATLELKEYIPEGCVLADGIGASAASVVAKVEEEEVRIIKMPVEQIALINVPQGYKAKIKGVDETITVRLAGLASALSLINEDEEKAIARHEIAMNLDDLMTSAKYILKNKAPLYIVHRCDRLEEILECLDKYNFKVKKLQFIYAGYKKEAIMVLIKATKNGNSGSLKVMPPIDILEHKSYKGIFEKGE